MTNWLQGAACPHVGPEQIALLDSLPGRLQYESTFTVDQARPVVASMASMFQAYSTPVWSS